MDSEYVKLENLTALFLTYNCNAKILPSANSLRQIIHERGVGRNDAYGNNEIAYDMVVVSLQEMVELSANNVVLSGELANERASLWHDMILSVLNHAAISRM